MPTKQTQIRISRTAHRKIQFIKGRLLEHGYEVSIIDILDSVFDELDVEVVVGSFLKEKDRPAT